MTIRFLYSGDFHNWAPLPGEEKKPHYQQKYGYQFKWDKLDPNDSFMMIFSKDQKALFEKIVNDPKVKVLYVSPPCKNRRYDEYRTCVVVFELNDQ